MLKSLMVATAIAFAIPAGAALAQDYDDWSDAQVDHGDFHDEIEAAHARAHERGFSSPEEHWAYHQALRDLHREYHYDHPDADNDIQLPSRRHPRWYQSYYGYYPYSSYYYYNPYSRYYYNNPYSSYYYNNPSSSYYYYSRPSYRSGWSFSFGGGW